MNEDRGQLKSPYPYFGGKSRIAPEVWARLGNPRNYVEPFFGSGAMLLARPGSEFGIETVNDLDGFIANFWRAVKADPEAVAKHADWPVNENDLHARHIWLVGQRESLHARLEGDPDWFDCKIAGWWVWGMACWIGGGFCSGKGPWGTAEVDGIRQRVHLGDAGQGVQRRRVHLGGAGQGVQCRRVHLGTAGQGVNRQLVHLGNAGQGVNRQLVHLGNAGQGLYDWMSALAERMRHVRVCSGDWERVCGRTGLFPAQPEGSDGAAVFLDPPYADTAGRADEIYAKDSLSVAHDVRRWCLESVEKWPRLRIALAGYEGEHVMPEDWECMAWKASEGYGGLSKGNGKAKENSKKERIWFSPACIRPGQIEGQLSLFSGATKVETMPDLSDQDNYETEDD